ncbi:unnamed protein product [Medioppia subpectinata]|uniref:BTB domain-containing protein n=1 Tax=Medioppia subpectinata TaxID=1979941 RepID=A0A7R9LBT6_9ACAR|nr:unnamed protein product [Medioppia subpectinata]CAG2117189.1 unnamed protein product [Medioppia subpectinata]
MFSNKRLDRKSLNESLNSKRCRFAANGSAGDHSSSSSSAVIDMRDAVIANQSQLFSSPKFSDVTIAVEDVSIPCHKAILGSQSDFFDRLFESQMSESRLTANEPLVLRDTDPQLFRVLLKLVYSGRLDFQELEPMDVIKLFGLIQRYQFTAFEAPFMVKIKSMVNASNVWQLFQTSMENHLIDCQNVCLEFLDTFCSANPLMTEDFFMISTETLKTLLVRNSLRLPEVDLFLLAKKFLEVNKLDDQTCEELIQCIRLPLMRYEDLVSVVSNSGLVSEQRLWRVMKDKAVITNENQSNRFNWDELLMNMTNRGLVINTSSDNTSLCIDQFLFEVMAGQVGDLVAPADQPSSTEWPIVVRLGFPLNVNHIDLQLSDIRGDRFSYKIQYSSEGLIWETLYDYTNFTTANQQSLYFETIVAQQFRIRGTHQIRMDSTTKDSFNSIKSFRCYYNPKQMAVERIDGLLANPYWIRNAIQQRVYHDSNTTGQQDMKYYSRLMASHKPIIVALDQPVMIDSFEFVLWDKDERAYSYVVEVKDGNDWIKLADKSQDVCRSLQTIAFSRRPISLVRVRAVKIHFRSLRSQHTDANNVSGK